MKTIGATTVATLIFLFGVQPQVIYSQIVENSADSKTENSDSKSIVAKVNRRKLSLDETLILSFRVFRQREAVQLDFTPLRTQFDVVDINTSNHIDTVDGNIEAWTDYTISLSPKSEGILSIPSLDFDKQKTQVIEIEVTATAAPTRGRLPD